MKYLKRTDLESADSCHGHKKIWGSVLCVFMFFVARVAIAQVSISEIMYNPKGADTGHEWVEIVNDGSSAVDLMQCKFLEVGTTTANHGITGSQGGTTLTPHGYAIIADNAQTFLADHLGFTGVVTDSSFSLNNTGETVSFKMPDGTISDTVTYASSMGGAEDGNSLQKIAGVWQGAVPTPGVVSAGTTSAPLHESTISMSTISAPANTLSNTSSFPVEPQIFADAGVATRIGSTGAAITFTGRVLGLKKEPIENARMVWSFGDGGRAEGASVAHTYYYPGEYIAVLDAASGYYSASDRVIVHVSAPVLSLHTGGDSTHSFVSIENRVSDEVDLSLWQIEVSGKIFILPQNTILGARKTLTFASEVTGLVVPTESLVSLHFPNGTRVETQSTMPATAMAQISNNSTVIATATPAQAPKKESVVIKQIPIVSASHVAATKASAQEAFVANAVEDISTTTPAQESGSMWPWYSGAAFLGVLALLGLRMTREKRTKTSGELTADDFEIVEDDEDKKGDIF